MHIILNKKEVLPTLYINQRNYLLNQLIMNNFVMNGVEIDSFSTTTNLFQMRLFKNFIGKFYSTLILT
jgi:hypothetical protein